MKPKILFVDDDPAFLRAIEFALSDSFALTLSESFDNAKKSLQSINYDLVILDYDLGIHSAEDLLSEIKNGAPVLVVTGKAEKNMAIRLLNLRIQGLIEKPVTSSILFAKINDILGSSQSESKEGLQIKALNIIYFQNRRIVMRGNQEISLTPIENKILETLLGHKNEVIKRSELCSTVWGKTSQARNVLDTHLYNLKRKIPALEKNLKTVYGDGLVLDV